HGLPGSQGPFDHTGRSKHFKWHTDPKNIELSLDIIEKIAAHYAGRPEVVAFSVINEPHETIGRDILVPFYEESYERVRRHMPASEVAYVLSAYPEVELPTYHNCLPGRDNVWTDVHLYQSFGDGWEKMDFLKYLQHPLERQIGLRKYLATGPVIVGEWSMSVAPAMAKLLKTLPPERQEMIMRMHGFMQLTMLEEFTGWFFWSYRVDNMPHWCFRDSVERGWLPDLSTLPNS
ncbi:MAG: cellulase family glycosylhydrolase, partial [Planctomycetes bacterium]|nr:cellulase family glycosylhydrolase [Planctomycetota bacterium]